VLRKVGRNVIAAACLLVGIAGLFLPFIQGIAMIVLALVIADFDAKERLLERYRHTRLGRHVWKHHENRKLKDAGRNGLVPESGPAPPATGESASEEP